MAMVILEVLQAGTSVMGRQKEKLRYKDGLGKLALPGGGGPTKTESVALLTYYTYPRALQHRTPHPIC